jgi:hypothetical protein
VKPSNPAIEVNFVDPFIHKGYRFAGTATVVERGAAGFENLLGRFAECGHRSFPPTRACEDNCGQGLAAHIACLRSQHDRGKAQAHLHSKILQAAAERQFE